MVNVNSAARKMQYAQLTTHMHWAKNTRLATCRSRLIRQLVDSALDGFEISRDIVRLSVFKHDGMFVGDHQLTPLVCALLLPQLVQKLEVPIERGVAHLQSAQKRKTRRTTNDMHAHASTFAVVWACRERDTQAAATVLVGRPARASKFSASLCKVPALRDPLGFTPRISRLLTATRPPLRSPGTGSRSVLFSSNGAHESHAAVRRIAAAMTNGLCCRHQRPD